VFQSQLDVLQLVPLSRSMYILYTSMVVSNIVHMICIEVVFYMYCVFKDQLKFLFYLYTSHVERLMTAAII